MIFKHAKLYIVGGAVCITLFLSFRVHKEFMEEVSFVSDFVKPGDLVFDVGAYKGRKAAVYLSCGARVVCVEPQPALVSHLHDKFLGDNKVSIVSKGVGSQVGKTSFFVCSKAPFISTCSSQWTQSGSFFDHGYQWDKQIDIELTTLDELIKAYGVPQFCKIDVENFEADVLAGLSQPIPYVSFEYHKEYMDNIKKCVERLVVLGYTQFNFVLEDNKEFALSTWVPAEKILESLTACCSTRPGWQPFGDVYARVS